MRQTASDSWRRSPAKKLLFDQNLAPRLVTALADFYPESVHVRTLGLSDATDTAIWEHARMHGFALVSKDADFQQRSLLFGSPPKFVWLRVGNSSTSHIESLLRQHAAALYRFGQDPAVSHLMLP